MKLTDTQAQILAAAAAHPHGLALPPDRLPAAARQTVSKALLKAGLVTAVEEQDAEAGALWRIDGEGLLLRITEVGLRAIGLEPAAETGDVAASGQDVEDAPQAPQGAPLAQPVVAEAPDTAKAAEAIQEPARAILRVAGRHSLREAATAAVAAWDASQDRAGMEAVVAVLRATLAGKPARAAREPGAPRQPREGTKQQQVLAMLRRPEGATIAQVIDATGWQAHTVRGFFAGLKTRDGIAVEVAERVRQVGPGKEGAKGSYSIYRIADAG